MPFLGRCNNPLKVHMFCANSSAFVQQKWYSSHICPLSVATIPTIETTYSSGGRDGNIIFVVQKILCTFVSPPTKLDDSQVTPIHNFSNIGTYMEPSIWADWSCNEESIPIAFRWRKRFNCFKTEMLVKLI